MAWRAGCQASPQLVALAFPVLHAGAGETAGLRGQIDACRSCVALPDVQAASVRVGVWVYSYCMRDTLGLGHRERCRRCKTFDAMA